MSEMAKYFGFSHVPILPYNAQANGVAESSVKRIKLLLDRHCKGYAGWHKLLPLAQLLLNTHIHTGHQTSPYMSLFGREPYGIEHLENPALLPDDGSGSEWLQDLRARMIHIHHDLQVASDLIKEARAVEQNLRRRSEIDPRAGRITAGSYVRILRGSAADAAYLRKHGHGETWKYRYKVLEVRPHCVRLEIPTDGSVPRISAWQLIRRCEPAPDEEILPQPDDPVLTERGIPLPPQAELVDSSVEDDDATYEIDKVLRAELVGRRYRLWIKWKGYADPTPMWRHQLESQSCNEELLKEIREAVERCREELQHAPAEDPVEAPEQAPEDPEFVADLPAKRSRRPVDR